LQQFLESLKIKPWARYSLEKMKGEKVEGGEVFIEPLGGVAILVRSVENLWDVPVLGLRVWYKKKLQGLPKTPKV
jgi:hypothetical protein